MTTSLAIGNTMARLGGYRFSPASLFAAGEQGVLYDPTDVNINWRRNLLTYTEEFDVTSAWTNTGFLAFGSGSVANTTATLDPIGGNTADLIVEDNATSIHATQSLTIAGSANTSYTLSRYIKNASGSRWFMLAIQEATSNAVAFFHFQPSTNTQGVVGVTSAAWSGVTAQVTSLPNGWYKVSLTATLTSAANINDVSRYKIVDAGVSSYAGDGTSGMYHWGAQLEQGSTATAYQQIITPEITYLQTIQSQPVLFTTSAGTTPVTGVEQFVGLMLDKSKGGVGTNGAKRVNLLTWTEAFNDAAWTKSGFNAFGSGSVANTTATTDPLGGNTADYIQENSANTTHQVNPVSGLSVTASTYVGSVFAKAAQRSRLLLGIWNGSNYEICQFDLANGIILQEAVPGIASMQSAGNGWWKCSVSRTIGSVSTFLTFGPHPNSNVTNLISVMPSYTGDGTSGIYIWGADLRLASEANTLPLYQLITSSWYATIPGNHAFQTNSLKRPKLAARYNLLTYSEEFDNAYWYKEASTVTPNVASPLAPDGMQTVDAVFETAITALHGIQKSVAVTSGVSYTYTFVVGSLGGREGVVVRFGDGSTDNNIGTFIGSARINSFTTGVSSLITGGAISGSCVALGNGLFRMTCTVTATASTLSIAIWTWDGSGANIPGDITKGIYIWGADLRPASQATGLIGPTYQRVAAATVYDTAGFLPYLAFDGLDDSMSTNSIDFSATDKMTVWAGVRKLANSDYPTICELSVDSGVNNGAFSIYASGSVGAPRYPMGLRGTTATRFEPETYTAPITNVLAVSYDIDQATRATEIVPRVNGIVNQTNGAGAADAGSGNFGNYPLYIGMRNNASLPFNGWLTSLIVRGTQSTQSQIEATEAWVAGKTGVQL